jgi:hypothetical protein
MGRGVSRRKDMTNWEIALLVGSLSLLTILVTYKFCQTVFQIEDILPRWAKQHGYRIVRQEPRTFFQGPFSTNRYRPVYYVTVEDQQRRQKRGWVRLGWWFIIGFREHIEVRWEE